MVRAAEKAAVATATGTMVVATEVARVAVAKAAGTEAVVRAAVALPPSPGSAEEKVVVTVVGARVV